MSKKAEADIRRLLGPVFSEDIDFERLRSVYTAKGILDARDFLEHARKELERRANDKSP